MKFISLAYFQPLHYNGLIISVDGLVIDYKLSGLKERDDFIKFLETLSLKYGCEINHFESLKMGRFRLNFSIQLRDGNSFWLGVGLNQTKTQWGRVRLEANPNKVARHELFRKVLSLLNINGKRAFAEIKRFDLAIDLPVIRENVFLMKDNRFYSELRYSESNKTEYLGAKSSHIGRCKLYNKTVESKLDYPLTRLEITLGNPLETSYNAIPWPQVFYIKPQARLENVFRLTETDLFILQSLLQGSGQLNQLGRKTRVKMKLALENYGEFLTIPPKQFEAIRHQLISYLHYPLWPLDETELDSDSLLLPKTEEAFSPTDWVEMKYVDGLPFSNEQEGG